MPNQGSKPMNKQSIIDHISKHVSLTPAEGELLFSKIIFKKYLKGQYVLQEGDVCQYQNYVISGCLKTFYADETSKEYVMMLAIDDWWTGDLGSFLDQTPAYYNIQCLEDTALARVPYQYMEELYAQIPSLERFFRIIVQKSVVATQKRVIDNFRLSGKEKYMQFRQKYPNIEQRVPQYVIASYLGITPEFLSKVRKELLKEG